MRVEQRPHAPGVEAVHVELLIAHHDRPHARRARERERETGLGRGRAREGELEIEGVRERETGLGRGGLLCECGELRHDPGAGGGARDGLEGVSVSSDEGGEGGVEERRGVARRDDCCVRFGRASI